MSISRQVWRENRANKIHQGPDGGIGDDHHTKIRRPAATRFAIAAQPVIEAADKLESGFILHEFAHPVQPDGALRRVLPGEIIFVTVEADDGDIFIAGLIGVDELDALVTLELLAGGGNSLGPFIVFGFATCADSPPDDGRDRYFSGLLLLAPCFVPTLAFIFTLHGSVTTG